MLGKKIKCIAKNETKVINNFGTGYRKTFSLQLHSIDGKQVSGSYIERRYMWIFPEKPILGELTENMKFTRFWINGRYSVTIIPDQDIEVEFL